MKNREKFREEIVKNAREFDKDDCDFINRNVLPAFGYGTSCSTIDCVWCRFLLGIWLEEEYTEPPKPEVDWENVPVDTLVRVRNNKNDEWVLRYFKKFRIKINWSPQFATWADGKTSKTVDDFETEEWKYCELVEDEYNDEQRSI